MAHLSSERVAAIAEGCPPTRREEMHLAACPACARARAEVVALMEMIRARDEPSPSPERWEQNLERIAARIAHIERRTGPRATWRRIMVPLAAAVVVTIVPMLRDSAPPLQGFASSDGGDEDFGSDSVDKAVEMFVASTVDVDIMAQVVSSEMSPWREIAEMTEDELTEMLALIDTDESS